MTWMIYGANGYTGELVAREAVRRGQRPILAGRNAARVNALASELRLDWRAFDLEKPDLSGIELVLHCAGPFLHTSKAMVTACLEAGVHYLDITGEIAVFEKVLRRDDDAKKRGIVLLPGAGFDVVPTDCLAAMLHQKMPDANELWLGFHASRPGLSPGTTKTVIEGFGLGGAVRRDGKIVVVPIAYDVREIPYSIGPRLSMTIPWGDVSTAYHSTGIPNIRVYNSISPKRLKILKRIKPFAPLTRIGFIKRFLQSRAAKTAGPSVEDREVGRVYLWGRVTNARGEEQTLTMTTREGYTFTVLSSLAAIEKVLAAPKPGAWTPSKLLGAGFVLQVPGTEMP